MVWRGYNLYRKYFKRIFDIISSGIALIVLSPVLLYIAYLVKNRLGSPVLFTQVRPGKDCKLFKMYKFRTMTDAKDADGKLLPDEVRLTPFGKKLRATSLDELPELLNIFKGDMSVAGPRPLSVLYLPYYNQTEIHRQDVLPGLTGWAQINGRNSLKWEDKFAYDIYYTKHISFLFDMSIIFETLKKVVKKENIGQGEMAPESFHIVRQRELASNNDNKLR